MRVRRFRTNPTRAPIKINRSDENANRISNLIFMSALAGRPAIENALNGARAMCKYSQGLRGCGHSALFYEL